MRELTRPVSIKDAFDKFFDERVIGDAPFGFDAGSAMCVYNHDYGGGCGIGCVLDRDLAARVENTNVLTLVERGDITDADLVEPKDGLWSTLQVTHDALARIVYDKGGSVELPGRDSRDKMSDLRRIEDGLRWLADASYPAGSAVAR